MKSLNSLMIASALVIGLCSTTLVAAAPHFSPQGPFYGNNGTLSIKLPSSFQAQVTCGISLSGSINTQDEAKIYSVFISGGGICKSLQAKNLPWILKPETVFSLKLEGVSFVVSNFVPASNCGANDIFVTWNGPFQKLSAFNQALTGNCTLAALDITLQPPLTLVP
ncbi:hypothetical protein QF008_003521 [Pseudomonas protegens]|jgi:hypothetical protein|uniref:alkane oxidation protein activator PraB n=1 Tax=Pseudomonas TaxID=286 RepID=UPI00080704F8|nr:MULTISPECIES: alkane oxidation protein activator PraB [Pseudomonas]MDK1395862.1 alkane oxidation protein activator PraB [Pseudomonas protegens]MDT3421755.1 hypothetical protein [Pseudomonas protegens]MDX9681855.1 alkane oxidation protein activator PraB [Pseudomonas protegens]OBZ23200.1 protein activator [Pseudomonas protegens]OBZ30430.1 protein activator [Pseudomonas protegens]